MRARSTEGDQAALEMLAFLQLGARDMTALKATDDLGWHRYHLANFAASRVTGAALEKQGFSESLLNEAIRDFPDMALLHKMRYERFAPAPANQERYLLDWLLAEYAGLTTNMVGTTTSTTLASLVATLRKRRNEAAPSPQ